MSVRWVCDRGEQEMARRLWYRDRSLSPHYLSVERNDRSCCCGTEGGDPTHAITPVENSHFERPSCPPPTTPFP